MKCLERLGCTNRAAIFILSEQYHQDIPYMLYLYCQECYDFSGIELYRSDKLISEAEAKIYFITNKAECCSHPF